MTTENVNPASLDAPKPDAAPAIPPGYISADMLTDDQIEQAHWRDRDALIVARSQAREAKRAEKAAADAKVKAESDASSKRAKEVTDEIVKRDAETPEEEKPSSESAEGYELKVEEAISAEHVKEATEYAHDVGLLAKDAGIPQQEAQDLFDLAVDFALTDVSGVDGTNPDATRTVLASRYGEEGAKRLIEDCQAAVQRLGPSVREYLNMPMDAMGNCLGNHPAVITALAHFHRGDLRLSAQQAQAEITKLRGTKEYQQGNRATVDRVRLLSRVASRGDKNEVKVPAKVTPVSKSALQTKLDNLRRDPAYADKYHANHREVAAQVAAIYAQMNPEGQ